MVGVMPVVWAVSCRGVWGLGVVGVPVGWRVLPHLSVKVRAPGVWGVRFGLPVMVRSPLWWARWWVVHRATRFSVHR